jgi:ubiquinone/menaquinone biosynthesis C-methylase UbiE
MTDAGCPGDGMDWLEAWRCQQERHRQSRNFEDGRHLWSREENARRYDASSRDEYAPRVAETVAGLPLGPSSRVLDIGAGPGTLALPIAPLVREVVAVEPAEGMVSVLEEHLARDGITNVRTVRKRWEEIDPATDLELPFDIVIASFSITMEEIEVALMKMDAVTAPGGIVALYWFLDPSFYEVHSAVLWPVLHGAPYRAGPKADLLFLVLVQLGFLPHVDVLAFSRTYRFADLDEALDHFASRFSAEDEEQRSCLRSYIGKLAGVGEGEGVVIHHPSRYAKVWWQKE